MPTIALTAETFRKTIGSAPLVFVDFWAPWCAPCRGFAPIYEKAAAAHPDIVFGKVNTEAERALAAAANITAIPTLMVFQNGALVFSQPGALPAAALDQVIASVRQHRQEGDQPRPRLAGKP